MAENAKRRRRRRRTGSKKAFLVLLALVLLVLGGVKLRYDGDFFHEFVTDMPKTEEILAALSEAGILGGLPVNGGILWCATEKVTKDAMDKTVAIVKEVLAK